MICKYLSAYDTMTLLLHGPGLRGQLHEDVTDKLKQFLARFGNKHDLYHCMTSCDLFIFDQSAYFLLFRSSDSWTSARVLYLACHSKRLTRAQRMLVGLGFKEVQYVRLRSLDHLHNYDGFPSRLLFRSDSGYDICLVVFDSTSRPSIVVSATSTAFMNFVSTESIWSGYPAWSRNGISLQHSAIDLKYRQRRFITLKEKAHMLILASGLKEYVGINRMPASLHHASHPSKVDDDYRRSDDDQTFSVYFGADRGTCSEDVILERPCWKDFPVKWFIGGEYPFGDEDVFCLSFVRRVTRN